MGYIGGDQEQDMSGFATYAQGACDALKATGVDLSGFTLDHIGSRIPWGPEGEGDLSVYHDTLEWAQSTGQIVDQTMVNGRLIAIVRLFDPFRTVYGNIYYLELPAPRPGKDMRLVITDHIEVVIPYSLSDFASRYGTMLIQGGYVSEQEVLEAIMAESDGVINPSIALTINGYKIKIHTRHIAAVVELAKLGRA